MALQRDLMANTGGVRPRLLVVQPLVGIGDMVWHKPWIDHLAAHFDLILACKPTAKAPTLFAGTDGIVEWLSNAHFAAATGGMMAPWGCCGLRPPFGAAMLTMC